MLKKSLAAAVLAGLTGCGASAAGPPALKIGYSRVPWPAPRPW
jgi:hypothetical protein